MLKWTAIALAGLAALAAGAVLVLPWLLNTPALQAYVAQSAGQALGRPVRFASLSVSGFPLPTVRLRALEVAEDPAFGPGPFLTVGEGRLGIRLASLLRGRLEMTDLTLDEPRVELAEGPGGRWNLASMGMPGAGASPPPAGGGGKPGLPAAGGVLLSRVRVVNGAVLYRKQGARSAEFRLERVNAVLTQPAPGADLRLTGDAVGEPGGVRLVLTDASLAPGGARSLAEMPLRASIRLEAPDVGPLAGTLAGLPGLSGPVQGELRLTGTAGRVAATGALTFGRLLLSGPRPGCPEPRSRQLVVDALKVPIAYTPAQLDSRPVEATVARGKVSLRLGLALGPEPVVTLGDVRVQGVELQPVLVDYLCEPYAVTGPLDFNGEVRLRLGDPWRTASGSGRFRIGPGRVAGPELLSLVNAVLGLAGIVSAALDPRHRAVASPLDFDSITGTYTLTDGVARSDDLLYRAADLRVEAAGTYALQDGRVAMSLTATQGANRFRALVSGRPGSLRLVPAGVRLGEPEGLRQLLERLLR